MESTMFEVKQLMENLWNEFKTNHEIYEEKGTKAAAARARKAINELKKHITEYKKASMQHVNGSK